MEGMGVYGYGYGYGVVGVDTSSFFAFESTGDSEVDARRPAERGTVAMEEDDAESCSCGDLGSERSDSLDFPDVEEEGKGEGGEEEEEEGGNAAEEEEEVGMRRDIGGGGGGFGRYESCLSVESKGRREFMNEMERNKLFWEACLAS